MKIHPFFDSRTGTLTYLVADERTGDAVVIDPVHDFEPAAEGGRAWTESVDRVVAVVREQKLNVRLIIETHPHADHLSGAQELKAQVGGAVAVSRHIGEVQAVFRDKLGLGAGFPVDGRQFDLLLSEGPLSVGSLQLQVLETPGHTSACLSLRCEDALFCGDALFLDDVGVARCDFPQGSAATLYESITQKLWTLPDATRVFVGHDYPPEGRTWQCSTTIASSRAHNVQLNEGLSRETFIERRSARDRTLQPPRLVNPSIRVNLDAGRVPPGLIKASSSPPPA